MVDAELELDVTIVIVTAGGVTLLERYDRVSQCIVLTAALFRDTHPPIFLSLYEYRQLCNVSRTM